MSENPSSNPRILVISPLKTEGKRWRQKTGPTNKFRMNMKAILEPKFNKKQ